jgi:uncharacterized DUF497 family protein
MRMKFKWDEDKAKANLSKHGVSFDEAKAVFDDPSALGGSSWRAAAGVPPRC